MASQHGITPPAAHSGPATSPYPPPHPSTSPYPPPTSPYPPRPPSGHHSPIHNLPPPPPPPHHPPPSAHYPPTVTHQQLVDGRTSSSPTAAASPSPNASSTSFVGNDAEVDRERVVEARDRSSEGRNKGLLKSGNGAWDSLTHTCHLKGGFQSLPTKQLCGQPLTIFAERNAAVVLLNCAPLRSPI